MSASEDRIVVLIDLDCFYCQVEAREQPQLKGKPLVVAQNNMVLAVSYEARAFGVNRFVRADEAKEKCPSLNVVSSPIAYGKSDITKYRLASQEVTDVLKKHCPIIERASIDEAFLDMTDLVDQRMESISCSSRDIMNALLNTFIVGYCDESNDDEKRAEGLQRWMEEVFDDMGDDQARKLGIAALIVEELRTEIYQRCQFTCSAGISYNKVLAKLACGFHKPNKQTILTASEVSDLFSSIPVNKVRNLGGKIGKIVTETLQCSVMSDLLQFTLEDLQKYFDEKTAIWLFNVVRGVDNEPVTPRLITKSIAACKSLFGKAAIVDINGLREWVGLLAGDLAERLQHDLEDNQRRASTLTVCYQYLQDKKTVSQSRTCPLASYKKEKIQSLAFDAISKSMQTPIILLSLATHKFVPVQKTGNFVNYFKNAAEPLSEQKSLEVVEKQEKDGKSSDDELKDSGQISNIFLQENENIVGASEKTALVKLREIFPDLNNIDNSILDLLPTELREEANNYLKSKNKENSAGSVPEGKSPKTGNLNGKSKINSGKFSKNNNTIQHYFVKSNSSNSADSLIHCNECNQMIEGEKYPEHCDFHLAQNLQKNINKSWNEVEGAAKRNREKSSSPKANKKTRSITSYFSR